MVGKRQRLMPAMRVFGLLLTVLAFTVGAQGALHASVHAAEALTHSVHFDESVHEHDDWQFHAARPDTAASPLASPQAIHVDLSPRPAAPCAVAAVDHHSPDTPSGRRRLIVLEIART